MKIYTKTGDRGDTSLFGGKRISKDEPRIEAYGTVDELNSLIGVARAFNDDIELDSILTRIQDQLFVLGADLATTQEVKSPAVTRIAPSDISFLERTIDEVDARLNPLKTFILPGGAKAAAFLHNARTVCRRAERRVVSLKKTGEIPGDVPVYLNRLSDLLFVLARYANKLAAVVETPWDTRSASERSA